MTGKEVLVALLKVLYNKYNLNIPDFETQLDNDLIVLDQAFQDMLVRQELTPVRDFIQCFEPGRMGQQFLEDIYTPADRLEFIDFTTGGFLKRKRSFGFSDAQFSYVSLSTIFSLINEDEFDVAGVEHKALTDFVCSAIALNNNGQVEQLYQFIENKNDNLGLLVHKFNHGHSSLSVYSYLYYKDLLDGNLLELDPQLEYTSSHGAVVSFAPTIIYEQYFEVFDIINELNHSKDIISRFLKIYHILEYLVYRVELVEIEKKARVNKSFIREIHGLAGKSQFDKEYEVLKRNFGKIFSAELLNGTFNLALTADQATFVRDFFGIQTFTHTELAPVTQLIYRLRNSIVHNKESEFHLTSTNPDEYSVIIPMIQKLIQILEKCVFDKISANATQIKYQSQNIQLY